MFDSPLERIAGPDTGPGPRWFSLFPPIEPAPADADGTSRHAPRSPSTLFACDAPDRARVNEAA